MKTNLQFMILLIKKYLLITGLSLLAFFAPITAIVLTSLCFVWLDFIMRVLSLKRIDEKFSFAKSLRTFKKCCLYVALLVLAFLFETFALSDMLGAWLNIKFPLTRVFCAILCYKEFFSIDEKIKVVFKFSVVEQVKKTFADYKIIKESLNEAKKDANENK